MKKLLSFHTSRRCSTGCWGENRNGRLYPPLDLCVPICTCCARWGLQCSSMTSTESLTSFRLEWRSVPQEGISGLALQPQSKVHGWGGQWPGVEPALLILIKGMLSNGPLNIYDYTIPLGCLKPRSENLLFLQLAAAMERMLLKYCEQGRRFSTHTGISSWSQHHQGLGNTGKEDKKTVKVRGKRGVLWSAGFWTWSGCGHHRFNRVVVT